MNPSAETAENTVLVLAPVGRDAELIRALLAEAGIESAAVPSLDALSTLLRDEVHSAVIIAEEAIRPSDVQKMRDVLSAQPTWSDVPIILLLSAQSAGRSTRGKTLIELFAPAGNISLMERPFHATTLVSSVQVAVRARQRQYEMRNLVEQLQASLQQRDLFMSAASHELKTPLTSLLLHTRMSLRAGGAPESPFAQEKVLRFLRHTDRQIARLTQLIDAMLDVTRIQVGKFSLTREPTDLVALVREVLELYLPQFKDGQCTFVAGQEPIVGNWDRHRLEQVVTNLLTNAIKYGCERPVEIRVRREGANAVIEVEDRGEGIPKEDHHRIFGRFERATGNGSVSGLGLGLFIVRNIVEHHGGTIAVESEPGRGSVFRVVLPMQESAALGLRTQAGVADADEAASSRFSS